MDFREICNYFGGSVSSDNLGLKLSSVKEAITRYEQDSQLRYSSEQQAALYLLTACYNIARGDFNQAFNDLQRIETLGDGVPTRWHIRRKAYKLFATGQQRHPPLLRFRPDAFEASGTIADAEFNIADVKSQMRKLRRELEQDSSEYAAIDRTELDCLQTTALDCAEHLAFQAFLHSEFPDNIPKKQACILIAQHMARMDAVPSELLAMVSSYRLDSISKYLHRLNIDAKHTRGANDAYEGFSELTKVCTAGQDELDLASAYIMHGDHLSSPPTTHPLALNLVTEGTLTGYDIDFWDESGFEKSHELHRIEKAMVSYNRALSLFRKNGCSRGQGAFHLRLACILHMESLQAVKSGEAAAAQNKRQEAYRHIAEAAGFFDLDLTYLQLTRAHKVLLDISAGNRQDVIAEARNIGTSCNTYRNKQISRFLGTLMLRFGRWQWLNCGLAGNALLCFQCAQVCSEASADPVYEYQATIAIAKLLCEQGSIPAAQAAYETALRKLEAARSTLTHLEATIPTQADGLRAVQSNLVSYLARVQNAIQRRASNPSQTKTLVPEFNTHFSLEQQDEVREASGVLTRLATEYSQALAEARSALSTADFDGYTSRIEDFLAHLSASYSTDERSVNGYRIMTLCLLGRYQEACAKLLQTLPSDLGGVGQDQFFNSVTSTTVSTSLGDFQLSMKPNHDRRVLEHSLGLCVWAKDWSQAAEVLSLVQISNADYLQQLTNENQTGNWQAQAEVGAIYEHNDGLNKALQWYTLATRTLEKCRTQTIDVEGRLSSMSSMNSAELFAGMIRVSLRLHRAVEIQSMSTKPALYSLKGEDWKSQALLFAEQSRARQLLDILKLADNTATATAFKTWRENSYVYRQYEDLIYNRVPVPSNDHHKSEANVAESGKLYDQISAQRDRDGSHGIESHWSAAYRLLVETDFQCNLSAAFASLGQDTLVLHCNTCIDSTIIFAISGEGIIRVKETELSGTLLRKHVLAYQKMVRSSGATSGLIDPQLAERVGSLLAGYLLDPFQDLISKRRKIIFVPSRELHDFPLCSLPFQGGPIFLKKSCSIIPCLTIFSHLANKDRSHAHIRASVFVNEDDQIRIAAVDAAATAKLYEGSLIVTKRMSRAAFSSQYRQASLVYFVTHGHEAPAGASPWQANVLLDPQQEEPYHNSHEAQLIRVMDLANFQTNASLVIFGACLAAKGHTTLGNDVIGFSHAVLESGAQCFIGALWKVSDWATAMLMQLFHKTLHRSLGSISLSECLQNAQIQFYHLTINDAVKLLEEIVANCGTTSQIPANESGWFADSRECAVDLIDDMRDPDKVFNFKDPYYWAAWVIVGHGDARLGSNPAFTTSHGPAEQISKNLPTDRPDTSAIPERPAPTPLTGNQITPSTDSLAILRQIHSVDSAGLPRFQPSSNSTSPGILREVPPSRDRGETSPSPPPPVLPRRPLPKASSPSPPTPPLPPRRPSQPLTSGVNSSINAPIKLPQAQPSSTAPRRKPVNQPVQSSSPPAYSARPSDTRSQQLQLQHRPRPHTDDKSRMHTNAAPSLNTARTATSAQRQIQVQRRPAQPQLAHPNAKQMQPQQLHHRPVGSSVGANRQQPSARPDQRRASRPSARVSSAGSSVGPAGNEKRSYSTETTPQPTKLSKRAKLKRFAKSPGGKTVIRLGTGMLVGSMMTGGIIAEAAGADWSFGGGDDGELDGGGFDNGGFDEGDSGLDAEATYMEGGEEEYVAMGEEDITFEDNLLLGAEDGDVYADDYIYEESASYEDSGAYEDAGGYEDVDYQNAGQYGNDELPGQTGPCFEDNVILSAAMP